MIMSGNLGDKKMFESALAAYSKGDFLDAQKLFMKIPDSSSVAPLAYYYIGLTFVQLGDLKNGVKWYKKVQKIDAEVLGVDSERFVYTLYINMASAMQATGEFSDAARIYEEALNIKGDDHRVKMNLGNSYLSLNDYTNAEKIFGEIKQSNPEVKEVYYCLGLTHLYNQNYADATEMFEIAKEKQNNSRVVLLRLYQSLLALGKIDEAESLKPELVEKYGGDAAFQEALEKKQKECGQ